MTFTAIDFETANYERTSACQIGIIVVKDEKITEEFSSFIKPVPDYFLNRFTDEIHGIINNELKKRRYLVYGIDAPNQAHLKFESMYNDTLMGIGARLRERP